MAVERMLGELATGDVPKISLGNFNWQPVDGRNEKTPHLSSMVASGVGGQVPIASSVPLAMRQELPAAKLTSEAFPLNLLEDKTFMGTGYNMLWRPRASDPGKGPAVAGDARDVLEINLTAETMAFGHSIGDAIPNRSSNNTNDLRLNGISYTQRVGAFENPNDGLANLPNPVGIHFEPGVFLVVPECKSPAQSPVVTRMASIPHGTTVHAQGLRPSPKATSGKPDIKSENIFPFDLNQAGKFRTEFFKQQLEHPGTKDNRLPDNFPKFAATKAITKKMFDDPNEVLRVARDNNEQEIESFVTFTLTTAATDKFTGGGTTNIGSLEGTLNDPNNPLGDRSGNAHAISMTVQYWIETVAKTLTIKAGQDAQVIQIFNSVGVMGPKFKIPSTRSLKSDITKKVRWTQVQYSQNVTLNFNTFSWPHISVATLGETGTFDLDLTSTPFQTPPVPGQ